MRVFVRVAVTVIACLRTDAGTSSTVTRVAAPSETDARTVRDLNPYRPIVSSTSPGGSSKVASPRESVRTTCPPADTSTCSTGRESLRTSTRRLPCACWALLFAPFVTIVVNMKANLRKARRRDRKSTRLNSSHGYISYAVFCLKKKKHKQHINKNIIKNV